MMRAAFVVFMGVALTVSAIAVVVSKHRSRALVNDLQQLAWERDRLETEWSQLQLEEAALASPIRVEAMARGRLQMAEPAQYIAVEQP